MNRTRLGLLGLCAALFAIMAFGASGAQAVPKFLVLNGSGVFVDTSILPVTFGASPEFTIKTLFEVFGSSVHVTCTEMNLIGASLQGEGRLGEGGKASFSGCFVSINGEVAPECEVHSAGKAVGTIETLESKGQLAEYNGEMLARIEPKTGSTFVTMQMGEACPIGENVPVTGTLFIKDCVVLAGATTEAVEHLIERGPLTVLNVFSHALQVDSSFKMFLIGAHLGRGWKVDP